VSGAYFLDLSWGEICELCGGAGHVAVENWIDQSENSEMECPACAGDGLIPHMDRCS
jgi:DnaJ-class molecular chaperone